MIGKTISHYKILEKLGEGGMGVVYKAEDTKLKRTVALKFLSPHALGSGEEKARFVHEAQAAASLSHSNICTVHEIDESEGHSFIAMEYVEGESLKDRIESGPLKLDEALNVAIQIAEGLQEAHEKGVVHRDIKPANVMITVKGQVKIMDFGLAKSERRTLLTQAGTTLGTIAYMSPEQTRGEAADGRTDIWSLGAVVYEMVTGQRPFRGDYEQAVVYSILNTTHEPVTALRTGVPMELERILDKAMAKSPAERYRGADEMLVDLRSVARHLISGRVQPPPSGSPKRRKSRVYLYGSIVTLVAAVLFIRMAVLPGRSEVIDSIAVLPLENLSGDSGQDYFADGMTEALIANLAKISALRVISRTSAMRYRHTDKSMPEIARELNVDAVVEGSVIRAGDRVRITAQLIHAPTDEHLWAESYERELSDVLALQGELARAIGEEIRVKLLPDEEAQLARSQTVDPEVYQLYLKGRYHWNKCTEEGIRKGLEYFEEAIKKDPEYAPAYAGLADSYARLASWGLMSPTEATPKAKEAALKALEIDDTSAEAHVSLALTKEAYEWNWLGAEREYKKAIELNPSYPTAYLWYAWNLMARGLSDEALRIMGRALELDPVSLPINLSLGYVHFYSRRYDEAIEQYLRTLDLDPGFQPAHAYAGEAYAHKGMFEKAIAEAESAVALSRDEPELVCILGEVYAMAGKHNEAREVLAELARRAEHRYVPPYFFAHIHAALGEEDEALEWLEKAYDDRDYYLGYGLGLATFDSMRDDPRFRELRRKIGLED